MGKKEQTQREILYYVREYVHDNGFPPTIREICAAVGLRSTSTVHGHLHELAEQGDIDFQPCKKRALRLTGAEAPGIPILGRVRAGLPLLAIENVEGYLPAEVARGDARETFALRVVGDSMTGAGIMDGDTVVVRQTSDAESGEIVVADLSGDTTVKRFRRQGQRIWLEAENPDYSPIVSNDIRIVGKVVACLRYY